METEGIDYFRSSYPLTPVVPCFPFNSFTQGILLLVTALRPVTPSRKVDAFKSIAPGVDFSGCSSSSFSRHRRNQVLRIRSTSVRLPGCQVQVRRRSKKNIRYTCGTLRTLLIHTHLHTTHKHTNTHTHTPTHTHTHTHYTSFINTSNFERPERTSHLGRGCSPPSWRVAWYNI